MANKQHLHKLLSDAIPVLCRNGLPPSVSFRVEALIGITVVDDVGRDVAGEGNVTVLSFQQTVSDSGVIASKFGNDPTTAVSDVGRTTSHTPRKRPAPKQTPEARFTVKQEYAVETSIKQEYGAESYPSYATGHPLADNTLEEYGATDGEEVEYMGEEGDYGEGEEYYEDDGQYYDDGSGYPSDVKFEEPDNLYMEGAGVDSYTQNEYMTDDYGGHSSAGRPPKSKAAKPRLSAAGAQPGTSRGRKPGGVGRGGTRPRAGKTSHDQATAIAAGVVGGGALTQKDSGYSRVVQDVLDSAVQQSLSDGGESCVCHICNMQLKNSTTLRDHIRGTHLAIKAHRCNVCGESFQWPMQVSRHKKRVHGSDGNQLMIFQ